MGAHTHHVLSNGKSDYLPEVHEALTSSVTLSSDGAIGHVSFKGSLRDSPLSLQVHQKQERLSFNSTRSPNMWGVET